MNERQRADEYRERIEREGAPLIDGERATFVWLGREAVRLTGDFNHWAQTEAPLAMERLADGLAVRTVELPPDAYIEYCFLSDSDRFPDPLNPRRVDEGMSNTNSYFWMPAAIDTPLAQSRPDVARGTVTSHAIDGAGYTATLSRMVHLYRPPVAGPVPLLVVFDGADYLHRAHLATIVDNLIAGGRIRPIAMALIEHGDQARVVEYACSDATVGFVLFRVLPFAAEQLDLLDIRQAPGAYGMMGASMGGLMSLYTALRAPEIFGKVLSQSGAFRARHLYYRSVIEDLMELAPVAPIEIWMDAGLQEWYVGPNREVYALLRDRGYDVTYREHNSGHNYPSWRNSLWRGLEALFVIA